MTDLFSWHPEVGQKACDAYAEAVVGSPVYPLDWQGGCSYTVESTDARTVVHFRAERSPLNQSIITLAKRIHPDVMPDMSFLGFLDNSTVSIWKMNKIHGLGFLYMTHDDDLRTKQLKTVVDMANFFVASWKCPQTPDPERVSVVHKECEEKLSEPTSLSPALRSHVEECKASLDDILTKLPWVLTPGDLSDMNVLINQPTGRLAGVVDWAEAAIWPFGQALYGLESILSFTGEYGLVWRDDEAQSLRALFSTTLQKAIDVSGDQLALIEKSRALGLLFRWGFVWRNEAGRRVPREDTTIVEAYIEQVAAQKAARFREMILLSAKPNVSQPSLLRR